MPTQGTYTRSLTVEANFTGWHAELAIIGELNPGTEPVLAEMLQLALDRHPRELVLNMRRVSGIDDTALQMIVDAARQLPDRRPPVILQPSEAVRKLLHATELDTFFPVEEGSQP
jgi:anti-anti-sigma factor